MDGLFFPYPFGLQPQSTMQKSIADHPDLFSAWLPGIAGTSLSLAA
jgi:hypothetical protein